MPLIANHQQRSALQEDNIRTDIELLFAKPAQRSDDKVDEEIEGEFDQDRAQF
jgi:hypothetical protein